MAAPMSFDVLVVGSGASGLAAALSAERAGARVALVAKDSVQSCNSAKAQGGIQAAFGEDDSPEIHAEDVWKSSHETANRRLVEVLTSEAPGAIHWLEELGVEFTRENGGYRLARCGGATRRRLLQVGDRTGHAITKAMREALETSTAQIFPKSPLHELEPTGDGWRARCGEHVFDAQTVVLAAGGRCFKGARDLDALQYHPNGGAWPATMQGYSIPETTRAYGATLLNAEREEFTDPLGPRDEVSQAIFDEVAAGRGVETPDGRPAVLLDTTRISEHDADISLPYMLRRYRAGGIDPLHEPILTYPVLHYQNGGLVIDEDSQTTIEGLFACGEIAGGTHGRNRMMGNSLLECTVFGRRAGAGRGLGAAYARAFAARGANVVVHDAGVEKDGGGGDPSVAQAVADETGGVASFENLEEPNAGTRVVDQVLEQFGRLDVVVQNAGLVIWEELEVADRSWDRMRKVSIDAPFQITRAAFPAMKSQGYGRFVFTTSGRAMSAERTRPGLAAYAVAKMAAVGLMFVTAAEGEPQGILANAIAPAAATRVLTWKVEPGELEPEQVVPGVLFLASEQCTFAGRVLEGGGGEFSVAQWTSSDDVDFGREPAEPEAIAERWAEIEGGVHV